MNDCNASTVTRSESWVHENAKIAIENIKIARDQKRVEIIQNGYKTIEELRKRSFFDRIGFPTLPKESTDETVKKWLQDADPWATPVNYYWSNAEDDLKRLISATDGEITEMMNLSTKDSATLERWLNWTPKKD